LFQKHTCCNRSHPNTKCTFWNVRLFTYSPVNGITEYFLLKETLLLRTLHLSTNILTLGNI